MEDLKKAAEFGERLGYEGIGLTTSFEGGEGIDEFVEEVEGLRKEYSVDLITCCEIDPESVKDMKSAVGKVRGKAEVVIVHGGNFEINKNAVRDSRIDILAQPERNRKDPGMDHKTTRIASENDIAVGIAVHPLINTYGKIRSHIFNHIKKSLQLCRKYNANPVILSGAKDVYGMRDPRELAAIPQILGFDRTVSLTMLSSNAEEIFEGNRKKLDGKEQKKGVEEVY